MATLQSLTAKQLRKALSIKGKIEGLEAKLNAILYDGAATSGNGRGRSKRSAATKARMAAAQRARWTKVKGNKRGPKAKRKMSAAGRARISAAAKRRWKAAKAAGKSRL